MKYIDTILRMRKSVMAPAVWLEAESAGAISINDLNAYEKELSGGKCDKCGTAWIKTNYKNEDLLINHYKPACRCYPRCPICNRLLMVETTEGLPCCVYCFCLNPSKTERDRPQNWTLPGCTNLVVKKTKDPKTGKESIDYNKKTKCGGSLKLQSNGNYYCTGCGKKYTTSQLKNQYRRRD